ncbi:hypothetical protein AX774_g926 [Zancudomyces culisetae]|uniref:Uncharacterized protein n=1 Tax=Zancudomyces culisetae TaxID=1213189 RepID=A0A1R1PXA8_ZANCU|nr:hypothetical protein AX774_g926 [Zancudomyces culisetae]|eukprot:OMH85537.1 hypothetical protein AX774_g926 [Zancudomyces culisetae]
MDVPLCALLFPLVLPNPNPPPHPLLAFGLLYINILTTNTITIEPAKLHKYILYMSIWSCSSIDLIRKSLCPSAPVYTVKYVTAGRGIPEAHPNAPTVCSSINFSPFHCFTTQLS